MLICKECGEGFEKSAFRRTQYFCSRRCSQADSNRRNNARKLSTRVLPPAACVQCGVAIEQPKRGRTRLFCSESCTQKNWAAAHPGVIRERRKRVYAESGDRIRAKSRDWNKANPEKSRARMSRWIRTESGKLMAKASNHRRRVRKRESDVPSFTKAQFKDMCAVFGNICLDCREHLPVSKLEPDHIVPLSRGGHNGIGNIQPLCRSCNALKGTEIMNFITSYALEGVVA